MFHLSFNVTRGGGGDTDLTILNNVKMVSYLDGSVNTSHTVRYALPKARGGGGRRDLSGLLLAEHDKFPKKVKK